MINYFKNKKSLGAVVATALLLIIVVLGVLGFQTWFSTFQSELNSDIEIKSSNGISSSGIETIIGNKLYFKNSGVNNISIFKVEIDGFDCNVSANVSTGLQLFDISYCLSNITTSTPEIVVFSTKKIYTEKIYIDNFIFSPISSSFIIYDPENDGFYLHQNGVTVLCPIASVNDVGFVNGIEYTKRTKILINITNANTTCTSGIDDMSNLFSMEGFFNQNISNWDTSNVTDMSGMFSGEGCIFNININYWNVSNVINMASMFSGASDFNHQLNFWDTSNVISMVNMFSGASNFNQNLSDWNTSKVIDMSGMFSGASNFNQSLTNFDTSNVINMSDMFHGSSNFNKPLISFNTSKVINMIQMFSGASNFNQPLTNFDTSNVINMDFMFYSASNFNQLLTSFNTSNVINMRYMFSGASNFNQSLINFNTSNVINMDYMFYSASNFNQNLSGWCVNPTPSNINFGNFSSLITSNLPIWGTC